MKTMVRRYCKELSPPRRRQFELKVMAEQLFKGLLQVKNSNQAISNHFIHQ